MSDKRSKSRTPRPATTAEQVDALVGMLLQQARLEHLRMGFSPISFDYDEFREGFYALAAAPPGTNSKADRYRDHARRGIHSSRARAQPGDRPVDNLPACEQST